MASSSERSVSHLLSLSESESIEDDYQRNEYYLCILSSQSESTTSLSTHLLQS